MRAIFLCLAILSVCMTARANSIAEDYISRGEDFLLAGEYESSIEDLTMGYQMASSELLDTSTQMRALFPLIIAYGHLNQQSSLQGVVDEMSSVMQISACSNTSAEKPILGPERISIAECINRVNGVTNAAIALCAAIPNKGAQAMAVLGIQSLGDQARGCCEAGGIWKGCLRPLVNKWAEYQARYPGTTY